MAYNEWPKTLYRYDENGEMVGKTFNAAADADAGWLSVEEFAALPVPPKPPKPEAAPAPVSDNKLADDNRRLLDSVKVQEDMIVAKDNVIQSQGDRILALQGFIEQVGADENCPPALKEAIAALFAPPPSAAPPVVRSRAKAKA